MSNFDDASGVRIVVKLTVKELIQRPYTDYQKLLFRKICILHVRESLTFKAIAEQLDREGYKSPTELTLTAEIVFGIYKKGKVREDRLSAKPKRDIVQIVVM